MVGARRDGEENPLPTLALEEISSASEKEKVRPKTGPADLKNGRRGVAMRAKKGEGLRWRPKRASSPAAAALDSHRISEKSETWPGWTTRMLDERDAAKEVPGMP